MIIESSLGVREQLREALQFLRKAQDQYTEVIFVTEKRIFNEEIFVAIDKHN